MREIRQSGSEGGVAVTRHPYPYYGFAPSVLGRGENREWMRMGRRHRVGWMIDMV